MAAQEEAVDPHDYLEGKRVVEVPLQNTRQALDIRSGSQQTIPR
jgi:hypothetical protein